MISNKSIEKYLWASVVIFVTYLFLGSFIVSRNLLDLAYLIILYTFMVIVKVVSKN